MTTATISKGKKMVARYPGKCLDCTARFPAGTQIVWVKGEGSWHQTCVDWREANDAGDSPLVDWSKLDNNCGKPGGCEAHDGECDPRNVTETVEYKFTPCWAGGRCEDSPACGC